MLILNAVLTWTIIIILIVLVGFFILNVLIGATFYSIFYHKLKKGRRAITIIIQAKYDLISKIIELLENRIDISNIKSLFNEIDVASFRKVEKEDFKVSKDNLAIIKNELFKVIKENKELSEDEEISLLVSNIIENDNCYRSQIVTYNSNIQGYSYWIKFLPSRFIFKFAKIKAKTPLS
ncbi:MAG: hypothetical protein ACI31G_04390 [Bacilli bacterium]